MVNVRSLRAPILIDSLCRTAYTVWYEKTKPNTHVVNSDWHSLPSEVKEADRAAMRAVVEKIIVWTTYNGPCKIEGVDDKDV